MRLNERCVDCLLEKKLKNYPAGSTPERVAEYQRRVRMAIESGREFSSPEVNSRISAIYRELFGPERDYSEIKRHFNALMLALEPAMQSDVDAAPDPLERAVQYAMAGNFIDFAALGDVDESELRRKLSTAAEMPVDAGMLAALRQEVIAAKRLVLFTDNCGEIVTDKVLLRTLRKLNPDLWVTVIVRELPVVNDATAQDAEQVRMGEVARQIIGNGSDLPGNVLSRLSPEAREAVDAAGVLISKGQGNYEGLSGCGRNIFYIFMCKCPLFTERFAVDKFAGVLTREIQRSKERTPMTEPRDKRGLTEAEAIAEHQKKNYPKPALTADICVFARANDGWRLLMIRRGGHPYLGCWALPGGFADQGETIETTAARELQEETGLTGLPLRLVNLYSAPGRDPRGWTVSAAYAVRVDALLDAVAADDAAEAGWFEVSLPADGPATVMLPEGQRIAFDHAQIIADAAALMLK